MDRVAVKRVNNDAADNLDRLWQMTERAKQQSLTAAEQQIVERMRLLLMLLLEDLTGNHQPPLSINDTVVIKNEIESLLQQQPFLQK